MLYSRDNIRIIMQHVLVQTNSVSLELNPNVVQNVWLTWRDQHAFLLEMHAQLMEDSLETIEIIENTIDPEQRQTFQYLNRSIQSSLTFTTDAVNYSSFKMNSIEPLIPNSSHSQFTSTDLTTSNISNSSSNFSSDSDY
jgi:hypothetical protein